MNDWRREKSRYCKSLTPMFGGFKAMGQQWGKKWSVKNNLRRLQTLAGIDYFVCLLAKRVIALPV